MFFPITGHLPDEKSWVEFTEEQKYTLRQGRELEAAERYISSLRAILSLREAEVKRLREMNRRQMEMLEKAGF